MGALQPTCAVWPAAAALLLSALTASASKPPLATPPWTSSLAATRSVGFELDLVPLRSGAFSPDVVVGGTGVFNLPLGARLALGLRMPFLARPLHLGSPSLALAWTLHRKTARARTAFVAELRVFAPVAPEHGDPGRAATLMRQLLPRWAASWLPGLTIAPSLSGYLATSRYLFRFAGSIETTATGPYATVVALTYELGFDVQVGSGLEVGAEAAGRAVAEGGAASDVGIALRVGYRSGHHAPSLRIRFPLGDAAAQSRVIFQLGWESRF